MTVDNIHEIEDISFDVSKLDMDASIGNEPVDIMLEDPGETREERKKRLDLICRNVIDGIIDINNLMIFDMMAVVLRMQEKVDELDQHILQYEHENRELTHQIKQLKEEKEKLRSYLQEVGI